MAETGELGLRILIVILIVGVIIYSIINIIFYYRAYTGRITGISSGFAIFMLIFSAVLLIVGIILGIWALYYIFRRSGRDRDDVEIESYTPEEPFRAPVFSPAPTPSVAAQQPVQVRCGSGGSGKVYRTGDLSASIR